MRFLSRRLVDGSYSYWRGVDCVDVLMLVCWGGIKDGGDGDGVDAEHAVVEVGVEGLRMGCWRCVVSSGAVGTNRLC